MIPLYKLGSTLTNNLVGTIYPDLFYANTYLSIPMTVDLLVSKYLMTI